MVFTDIVGLILILFLFIVIIYAIIFVRKRNKKQTEDEEIFPPAPGPKFSQVELKELNIKQCIEEIKNNNQEAEDVVLRKIHWEKGSLIGRFLIKEEKNLLKTKKLCFERVAREEIKSEVEISGKEGWIPLESVDFFDTKILVDEYSSVYLLFKDSNDQRIFKIIEPQDIVDTSTTDLETSVKHWLSKITDIDEYDLVTIEKKIDDKNPSFLISDPSESDKDHFITTSKNGEILNYELIHSSKVDITEDEKKEPTKLPFSHGIEVELQVVNEEGCWIDGNQMSVVFKEILREAKKKISNLKGEADFTILQKWSGDIKIEKDDRGYQAVCIEYLVPGNDGESKTFSVFGKDSHVDLKTNILEIQTPPCEYLEELEWWIHHLYRVAQEAVSELGTGATILSLGSNPLESYEKGVTFGEHHHIGIPDKELRIEVYNMLRNYMPHLIALTSNSPFIDSRIPKFTTNSAGNLVILDSAYSTRLKKNKDQFKLPPYLPKGANKDYLKEKMGREKDRSLRMVDIFPFTRFDTLEVRIFDTQLTTCDRLSNAVLLQSIALLTKNLTEDDENVPQISDQVLNKNREVSINDGLLSRFYKDDNEEDNDLIDLYQSNKFDNSKNINYLFESCENLMYQLSPYFEELDVTESKYVDSLLLRLYGTSQEGWKLNAPFSPSQFLLYWVKKNEHNIDEVIDFLKMFSKKNAQNTDFNPLISYFGIIEKPSFLRKRKIYSKISIPNKWFEAGIDVPIKISFKNQGDVKEKGIKGTLLLKKGNKTTHTFDIEFPVLKVGETAVMNENIPTLDDPGDYNITVELRGLPEKQVIRETFSTYSLDITFRPLSEVIRVTDNQKELSVPFLLNIENPTQKKLDGEFIIDIYTSNENKISRYRKDITIEKGQNVFVSKEGEIPDWADKLLGMVEKSDLPNLTIETDQAHKELIFKTKISIDGTEIMAEKPQTIKILSGEKANDSIPTY